MKKKKRGRDKNGDAERGLKLARRREAGAGGKGEEPAGEILEEINTGRGARAPTVKSFSGLDPQGFSGQKLGLQGVRCLAFRELPYGT